MSVTRRDVLRIIGQGAAAATAITVAAPEAHAAVEGTPIPTNAVGMLYDATLCIGCKSCVPACSRANNLPIDVRADGIHQAPADLNDLTRNIIKAYQPTDGSKGSFVKKQCMHCIDPACTAGCPFQALSKNPVNGAVTWDKTKCIGCRYCTIACPFQVPRFQWVGYNPRVNKCELCVHRIKEGREPGCTEVCPTKAVIYGPRAVLLAEAKKRIEDNPGKYFENRVYGERDGGGTQVLYLAAVPFEKIGLPALGTQEVPENFLKWQSRAYKYMALPAAMYVGLVATIRKSFKKHEHDVHEEEKQTGLRAQL